MDDQAIIKFKQYINLSNHYLKIILTQEFLSLICFDNAIQDNILYQYSITPEEIKENSKMKQFNITELYDKIIDLIEKKKYLFNEDKNLIVLSLFEGESFDINKDLQLYLIKTKEDQSGTYEETMKKIIRTLFKENTELKTKLDELQSNKDGKKRLLKRGNILQPNISNLENLNYNSYPMVELNTTNLNIISGYGGNSYDGIKRKTNENRLKIITNYKLPKPIQKRNGDIIEPKINYFAIYDGHGGEKCCNFLQENLHNFIFSSKFFPLYTIQAINEAYAKAEEVFSQMVIDPNTGKLSDKSGSCAVSALIMNEFCFITNLGDSRALYSFDSGNKFFQVTRDHKPNDPIERERIEKAGGKVYKEEYVKIKGQIFKIDEKQLPPGVSIPYRVIPGNISVRKIFIYNKLY